jgi:hypothetical protein
MFNKKPEGNNPQEWLRYHQPAPGRVPDHLIVKAIREMADYMQRYVTGSEIFYSNDLCIAIWDEYGNQHVNIGIRITPLIGKYKLPIRRIGTHNNRALYSIEIETVH